MVVTLLTDFGVADYFVGAMKGAILSVNPHVQLIDITHDIPPHDIRAGAFMLLASFESFPSGTIHVAVVDPGVGSSRRPVLVEGGGHFFVGPDNGLFGYVYERLREFRVVHLTRERYFRTHVSSTFHGRDIFAPIAGALSNGVEPDALGEPVGDFVRLESPAPLRLPDGTLEGSIIHIDRFGNCITNFSPRDLSEDVLKAGARLVVGEHVVNAFRHFFAGEGSETQEPFVIPGSAGFLEIAFNGDSAARRLNIKRGQPVRLIKSS